MRNLNIPILKAKRVLKESQARCITLLKWWTKASMESTLQHSYECSIHQFDKSWDSLDAIPSRLGLQLRCRLCQCYSVYNPILRTSCNHLSWGDGGYPISRMNCKWSWQYNQSLHLYHWPSPDSSDVINWTNTSATSFLRSELNLASTQRCYIGLKAYN